MSMPLFRLFVSSTFADFQLERAILHEAVFPRVARYCERQGATFQPVDLRWGVTDQVAADQQTMQVCLAEVKRCQELSPRPNFLVMLGDRYGWQPLPDWIGEDVYRSISAMAAPEERMQLRAAYAVDDNAVPRAYRLRRTDERSSLRIDEAALRALLERGAAVQASPARQVALVGAATHQEVMLATMHDRAAAGEVIAWLRDFDAVPAVAPADWAPADYTPEGGLDEASGARLARLKRELGETLPARMCSREAVPLADYRRDGPGLAAYRRRFARFVLQRLVRQIRAQLLMLRAAADPDPEDAAHRRFGTARRAHLLGRDAEIGAIVRHLSGSARQPLVLTGAGGGGKTSIMAGVAGRLRHGVVIERYVGATPESSSLRAMLAGLCAQLDRMYRPQEAVRSLAEADALDAALAERLRLVSKARPLYLLIDSLDQFAGEDRATLLRWLPADLPRHVRIALSCRDGFPLPSRIMRLVAPPLPQDVARQLMHDWLAAHGRTLTGEQRAAVEAGYEACPLALWLRLASEQARHWHSDSGVPALPGSLDGMVTLAIASLRRRHAPVLLTQALAYLAASRFGLSELELERLLAADPAVQREFDQHSHHPWDLARQGLPPVLWSRLRLDLGPYLVERAVDGTLLLAFFHREFTEVIVREMVVPQAGPLHAALARSFSAPSGPELVFQAERGEVAARRRLTEQTYQLAKAGDGAGLSAVLADFAFVMAKCGPDRLSELLHDHDALAGLAGPGALARWREFLRSHAGLLAQADARWPAYKILLQLAQEQAPEHPAAMASDAWLASGACSWRWARRVRRPTLVQAPAVLAQFGAPADEYRAFFQILELDAGRIVSFGAEREGRASRVVRIWNSDTGLIEHELDEHEGTVRAMDVLPGALVATLAEDGFLRIFSADSGSCVRSRALGYPHARSVLSLDAEHLVVTYAEPARAECYRVRDLSLASAITADILAWRPYRIGARHLLLADRITWHDDEEDGAACYRLWTVATGQGALDGAAAAAAVEVLGSARRLADDSGRTLLWNVDASDLRLLTAEGLRSAALPAPAADACLVGGWGIAVVLLDERIALFPWSGIGGRILDPREHGPDPLAWSLRSGRPEGSRWGVCILDDGTVLAWQSSPDDGHAVLRWQADDRPGGSWAGRGWLDCLVAGPDGRILASYVFREDEGENARYPIECRRGDTGEVVATMRGHFNYIDALRWLPDGRVLSWSEDDGTVRTWDGASGLQLAMLNLEGFISDVRTLGDGSLLVSSFDLMLRFNPDFRDEPFIPCGGVQMKDGLALAFDDTGQATLWRTRDRRGLSVVANSGDIARVRRCGDHLLVWDRSARVWTLWADGDRCLLATIPAGASDDAEDDAVFLLEADRLVSLLPLGGEAFTSVAQDFLLQHHALDESGPVLEVVLDKPGFAGAEAHLLSAQCVALVGDREVVVHTVQNGSAHPRNWMYERKLAHRRVLEAGLLCCFGDVLCLWDERGELRASRVLPAVPVDVLVLPQGRIGVCLPHAMLALDAADLRPCWQHDGASDFRYRRITASADGRLLLESFHKRQLALEVLDRAGGLRHRLTDVATDSAELRPLLSGDSLVVFGKDGRWQHWDLAQARLLGEYTGVPESADGAAFEDGGRLLWIRGSSPCLFDTRTGAMLAGAQPLRSGLWLAATPFSDTGQADLIAMQDSGWPVGEQVFWTNGRNRKVIALSDASQGRMLLKGANWFMNHQHYGFWIQLMHGARPQADGLAAPEPEIEAL